MVAGPYVKQGHVSSVQYDHTSVLRHLSNVLDFEPLTLRSAVANDLSDCIDFERLADGKPSKPVKLPAVEVDESMLDALCEGSHLRVDHEILRWADSVDLGKFDCHSAIFFVVVADVDHGHPTVLDTPDPIPSEEDVAHLPIEELRKRPG